MDLVGAANKLRQAADPGDPSVTVISPSYLVMNDTAYAAWDSVFKEARLNSPAHVGLYLNGTAYRNGYFAARAGFAACKS